MSNSLPEFILEVHPSIHVYSQKVDAKCKHNHDNMQDRISARVSNSLGSVDSYEDVCGRCCIRQMNKCNLIGDDNKR